MIDFLRIIEKSVKKGVTEISPEFLMIRSRDLMIKGGDFYAVWLEDEKLWSTDEFDVVTIVDRELNKYATENQDRFDGCVTIKYMVNAKSGMIDDWHKYCKQQLRDSYHLLDEKILFSNMTPKKTDYASKRLNYPLEKCDISSYDEIMSTLYSPEERHKLEWAIGSIVTGDSKHIQKFIVMYGSAGTGKSTVLNIIQMLFEGYYTVFDAKALGSSNSTFALEPFKNNPLVAIQHDGDLSRIEDNTRLNSIVSHESMTVNEKYKSTYANKFKCFLFMGTNRPVKITDSKSGLLRRLIDVSPSGNKIPSKKYFQLMEHIQFELPGIAFHCKKVYLDSKNHYDGYVPLAMISASNDFYNFMCEQYLVYKNQNAVTMKSAWEDYKKYCEEARVNYPYTQRVFKEELKNYFYEYHERYTLDDGTRVRSYLSGFNLTKFDGNIKETSENHASTWIDFKEQTSIFDSVCAYSPAQYANDEGAPSYAWSRVKTKLCDIDTHKLHYVRLPLNHIVIDFDIPDENGNKCFEHNLAAASKFPPTYAEVSKSGAGVHLHYIYKGDPTKLKPIFDEHIEVKVFNGRSSLRRMLSLCNDRDISELSTGLPLKEEKETCKVMNEKRVRTDKGLRRAIVKNLNKEYWPSTTQSIQLIKETLDNAYKDGFTYDVRNMFQAVYNFAQNSTHKPTYCLDLVSKMKFYSKDHEVEDNYIQDERPIAFYDVEVYPNFFPICFKTLGKDMPVIHYINPDPSVVKQLYSRYRLIGFNCRRYDNHIMYARGELGYSLEQLYHLSQNIINDKSNCLFLEAYNLSYADVYDFSSKKQSLKKFEIELGIHHQEMGIPWNEPVDEKLWPKVIEYCSNDVIATEAVFNARKADWSARLILAELTGLSPNTPTSKLAGRLIFGAEKNPQKDFRYRSLAEPVTNLPNDAYTFLSTEFPEMVVFNKPRKYNSILPFWEGYTYENGVSTYRGEKAKEGGYVYGEPGIYFNVSLLDIASMHPTSIIAEFFFGVFTKRYKELKDSRIFIKHGEFDKLANVFDGKLQKYISDETSASDLAYALKIVINIVYGLTRSKYETQFRDVRNIDNFVAKRGSLFMIDLKHAVQDKGYTVAHIKTDSIKIPNADDDIIKFVMDFGKEYGYTFEHEATYERMCLVNDSTYIARYPDGTWTATAKQFKVPYVFKTLFSHEPIEFKDLCETRSVETAIYLDFNENLSEDEHNYMFVGKVGSFCPMKPGTGGAVMVCDRDGKYNAVNDTKGYRWMESEMVKSLGKEDDIDMSYYENLADKAVAAIEKYGKFEDFVNV